jgi:hypothetical protein
MTRMSNGYNGHQNFHLHQQFHLVDGLVFIYVNCFVEEKQIKIVALIVYFMKRKKTIKMIKNTDIVTSVQIFQVKEDLLIIRNIKFRNNKV